ncbi:MFS transporter [Streptomyces sp. SPB074]|uniref:MFS transporter n=1 Tax=Streptomyces sp. (strain SPB074) TaxID=465543 RepID=UPI00017F2576|nr:MFS transporter [Streptomyces sp. SPB074]EDY42780.1 efflux protein [Streptomyces sp. SPB074]
MNVLRVAQFRRYLLGQAASQFGDSLVPLTIAFAALDVSGPGGLGLVLAANRLPVAGLVLVGGALGDRWPRRALMVGADVSRCVVQVACGVLLLTGHAGLASLIVLQALAGAGTALFVPAASGLVPSLVGKERVQEANALLGLVGNINKVASISVAGVLVAWSGTGTALLVDGATFALSALALAGLRLPARTRSTSGRPGLWREIRDGARLVLSLPWLTMLLGYGTLLQALVIGPHMIAGPLLAEGTYGGAAGWAVIGVAQAAGSIAGGLVALRWRPRQPLVSACAVGLLMVPYLLVLALGGPLWAVCVLAVLMGGQGSVCVAVQAAQIQRRVPEEARSRVAAWSQLGNLVALPASLAVAGPLAAHRGGGPVLLAAALWLVLSTGVVLAGRVLTLPATTTPGTDAPSEASPANG